MSVFVTAAPTSELMLGPSTQFNCAMGADELIAFLFKCLYWNREKIGLVSFYSRDRTFNKATRLGLLLGDHLLWFR